MTRKRIDADFLKVLQRLAKEHAKLPQADTEVLKNNVTKAWPWRM
jgi:hypothetical protein